MKSIDLFSKFVLRTPTFPYDKVDEVLSSPFCFEQITSDPLFAEAIFIASQSLYNRIYQCDNKRGLKSSNEKILNSVIKYYSRMSMRCTPFGLFAACSVGNFSLKDSFCIEKDITRTIRLDHSILCDIMELISTLEGTLDSLMYYPNNSLYKTFGNRVRYIEPQKDSKKMRKYLLEEILFPQYLSETLAFCRDGASRSDLIRFIRNKYETDWEEASCFLQELVKSRIVVPELYYSVTGDSYLDRIIKLPCLNKEEIREKLQSIRRLIEDNKSGIYGYSKIQKELSEIGVGKESPNFVQIDLTRNSDNFCIGENFQNAIKEAFYILSNISPKYKNQSMEDFKNRYSEIYQTQEVPLTLVLDPDIGIGYPIGATRVTQSSMIDEIQFPQQSTEERIPDIFGDYVAKNAAKNQIEFDITNIIEEQELKKHFTLSRALKYSTLYTRIRPFTLLNSTETLFEINSFYGSSALNIISRFAHTSTDIMDLCKEIVSWENQVHNENLIIAEIVHLPEDRAGNVTYRPLLRDYEIPYISSASTNNTCTLNVNDLYISLQNNELTIRSKKLNKKIIPRLSNAHNFVYNKLPIYRFLCDYQAEVSFVEAFFPKSKYLQSQKFFPRIRYKNIIFTLATWIIEKNEVLHLFDIEDEKEFLSEVCSWRESRNIPEKILFCEGDNELYVNLLIPNSIRAFLSAIKNSKKFMIKEFSYPNSVPSIQDENGSLYCGEIFVALKILED